MNKIVIATIFTCLLCIFKVQAQTRTFEIRHNVPLDSIRLSDPAILADQKTKMYYMTGTGGMMWRSPDLKLWEGPYRVTEFDKDSWMGSHPMIWAAELHQTGDGWYYYFAPHPGRYYPGQDGCSLHGSALRQPDGHRCGYQVLGYLVGGCEYGNVAQQLVALDAG